MIPVQGYDGKTVAVLGLGRTGLAAAAALTAGGANVIAWDDGAAGRAKAELAGIPLVDFSKTGALDSVTTLITSPGIPHLYPAPHPAIANAYAAGIPVDNDIGLFFRSFATEDWDYFEQMPKVIAVTGSNGKSTTSALLHHILAESGRPSQLGGNIGRGVLDLNPARDGEVVVLELSSYQTELARALTPDIAVFTNLSPDHLDRHAGRGGYFAAKRRLFAEGGPDRAVIGVDENEGRFMAGQLSEGAADDRVIRISVTGKPGTDGWWVVSRKGFLTEWRKGRQVGSIDLRGFMALAGAHNHQNACCAYAAARAIGLGPKAIEAALASFGGLPHRSQYLGEKDGVRFVNDSKATNVQSAAVALMAYKNIRWIAGGRAKDGGLDGIGPGLSNVRRAYLIGEAAERFAAELTSTDHVICGILEAALAAAMDDAETGDTILLSPAAASFDQFPDFEKRGEAFAEMVRGWLG